MERLAVLQSFSFYESRNSTPYEFPMKDIDRDVRHATSTSMATVYVPSGIALETWNENGAGHKHVTKYVFFFTIAQPEFFKTARSGNWRIYSLFPHLGIVRP